MRIEWLPIFLGLLVGALGGTMIYDATGDPESGPLRERRRRIRESIDRLGEQMVGAGTLLLGVALIGRDTWRFGTLAVLIGTILVIWGGIRNRAYIREMLLFRGAARRGEGDSAGKEKSPRLRIR